MSSHTFVLLLNPSNGSVGKDFALVMASKYHYEPKYGIPRSAADISEDHLAAIEDTLMTVSLIKTGRMLIIN